MSGSGPQQEHRNPAKPGLQDQSAIRQELDAALSNRALPDKALGAIRANLRRGGRESGNEGWPDLLQAHRYAEGIEQRRLRRSQGARWRWHLERPCHSQRHLRVSVRLSPCAAGFLSRPAIPSRRSDATHGGRSAESPPDHNRLRIQGINERCECESESSRPAAKRSIKCFVGMRRLTEALPRSSSPSPTCLALGGKIRPPPTASHQPCPHLERSGLSEASSEAISTPIDTVVDQQAAHAALTDLHIDCIAAVAQSPPDVLCERASVVVTRTVTELTGSLDCTCFFHLLHDLPRAYPSRLGVHGASSFVGSLAQER